MNFVYMLFPPLTLLADDNAGQRSQQQQHFARGHIDARRDCRLEQRVTDKLLIRHDSNLR